MLSLEADSKPKSVHLDGRKRLFFVSTMSLAFFLVTANIIIVAPLLPFIAQSLMLTQPESALILAAFPVVAFVLNLVVGPFIDHYGAQRALVIGALSCALSFAASAFATSATALALLRGSTGLFMPLVGASIFACLSDRLEETSRVQAVGIVTAAASIAQLTVAPFAVMAGQYWSWNSAFVALAVISAVVAASVVALWSGDSPVPKEAVTFDRYRRTFSAFRQNQALKTISIAYIAAMTGAWVVQSVYPTWLFQGGMAAPQVAMIYIAAGITGTIAGLGAGALAARFTSSRHLLGSLLVGAAASSAAISALPATMPGQLLAFALLSASIATFIPVARALVNALVPQDSRGSLNALWNAYYQVASSVGATAGVFLLSPSPAFLLNALTAVLLLGGGASVLLWKR